MNIPSVGERVSVHIDRYEGNATVLYVDHPNIYRPHFLPIQVEIDQPYDDTGQTVLRVNLKEINNHGENHKEGASDKEQESTSVNNDSFQEEKNGQLSLF